MSTTRELAAGVLAIDRRDPCTPTVVAQVPRQPSIEATAAQGLARVQGALAGTRAAAVYELNIMNMRVAAIIAAVQALLSAGTLPALPSLQTVSVAGILDAVRQQAEAMVAEVVTAQVNAAIRLVTDLAVAELYRDGDKVIEALSRVNNLLGAVEAQKVLVNAIFHSLDCPAKAAMLAEVYFNARRR